MKKKVYRYTLSQVRKDFSFANIIAECVEETKRGDLIFKAKLLNEKEVEFFIPFEKTFIGKNKDKMQALEPAKNLIDYIVIK